MAFEKDNTLQEIHPQLIPGMRIGNYQIDEVIGQGGMGKVYRGTDLAHLRTVAIKEISLKQNIDFSEMEERFRREYQFLSTVHHPNIVQVYDFFKETGQLLLVMEFVAGETLQNIINVPKSLSLLQQIALASQLASAIEMLNMAGILHRDIKPTNIVVNLQTGQAKLLDLGLGKYINSTQVTALTQTGTIVGTPAYLSPEQTHGQISECSDVFSLGVTLYQFFLWLPKSPFKGNNAITTMDNILGKKLPWLYTILSKEEMLKEEMLAYQKLSKLLDQATNKDPYKRPTAQVFAAELVEIYQSLAMQENFIHTTPEWQLGQKLDSAQQQNLQKFKLRYKRYTTQKKQKNERGKYIASFVVVCAVLSALWFTLSFPARPVDIPQTLWQKCWNGVLFDFTKKNWEKLALNKKIKYTKAYQKWHAKNTTSKTVVIGKVPLQLVWIPPGKFWMGSPKTEKDRNPNEHYHQQTIAKGFWMSKYETTQQQWLSIVQEKPWSGKKNMMDHSKHPVTYVSIQNIAQKFLARLPRTFSLPTETQWEYACRASSSGPFYWGNIVEKMGQYANVCDQTAKESGKVLEKGFFIDKVRDPYPLLAPVGKLKPNAFGLHDMIGNVWEWCYSSKKAKKNQKKLYVIRGGSWLSRWLTGVRCARRRDMDIDFVHSSLGMRLIFTEQ